MLTRAATRWMALTLIAITGVAGTAQAAGDVVRGKVLSYTCLGCHGIESYKNVYPTYSVPRLVGQHPEYLVAALKAYKNKERSHPTMHAQATSLSEQDMQDIAAYFAGDLLKSGAVAVGTAPKKVTELCVACHGKDGVGITVEYPTIAGQHWDYIERTLLDYKRGNRKNAIMGTFVNNLSDEDIRTISEYYGAQKPTLQTVKRRSWFFSN